MCRELLHRLQWNKRLRRAQPPQLRELYDADELAGVIPCDYRNPYDMGTVVRVGTA